MPFSFFGLVLKPHKTYTQKVSRPFRVTMATYGEKVTEGDRSCVKVAIDGETYVLCALSAPRVEQQPLDVVFEVNDEITFSSSGQNIIYLTGNYLPDENDDESDSEDMESEDLDSDECEDDIVSDEEISDDMLKSLRAAIGQDASSDSDEDDEDDPDFVELEAEDDDGEDSSSDISEVEDEDEEGDSDKAKSDDAMDLGGEEESTGVATGSKRKAAQKSPQQSEKKLKDNAAAAIPASSAKSPAKNVEKPDVAAPLASVADTESTPKITLQDKTSEKKVPQSAPPKTAAAAGTPSRQVDVPLLPNTEQKTKRQRKAERKKAKMDAMAEAGKASVTAGDKQNKNEKTTPVSPKSTADSGVATEDVKSGNGVIAAKNSKTPKKTFDNGLVVEDVKVGNGAVAAKGKKVTVRYIGKLVKNGKVFDKNVNGKPFSFVLGQGEVIKGWDLGFENMKVGGERRLIIPGPLAYGARGAPPDIPKNAALEFEVKLLKVD